MMSMMMGGARYGLGGASVMTSPGMTSSLSPDPPSPAHSGDSSCSNVPPTSPAQPRGMSKECGVCGDVAKSMHFGGLSCDSCKAFFRRSVQNNAYKIFSCPYDKNCVIGVSSRKACQYCRFEKCLSIGMEKGWVMSEEERRKMMEQRKEKKSKQVSEGSPKSSDSNMYSLSEEDRNEIALIVALYKKAYETIPYEEPPGGEGIPWQQPTCSASAGVAGKAGASSNGTNVMGPYVTFCQRILYFFTLFRDFTELSMSDQSLLLRTALTSSGIIMGSVVYDSDSGKWAAKINRTWAKNIPSITAQSVEKLVPTDLITRVDKFFKKFQQICPDETMAMILILVALYSPELMGLEARERVQLLQDRYIHILQNYVKYKFKEKSSIMFPKAIVSLRDIRELADRTGQMRLQGNSASFFSGMMPSVSSAALGSPYSGLALSSPLPPQHTTTGDELVPVDKATALPGPKNDPTYQRIMNVINQVYASINGRPPLLPVIIQLLKKCALANQERKSGSKSASGSQRRASRHSRNKAAHRVSMINRSRLPSLKRELSADDMSLTIKEEVMDHSEDTLLSFTSDVSHPYTPEASYGSAVSPQGMMTSFPQHQQSPFDQVHGATIGHPPSSSSSITHSSPGSLYHHHQQPAPPPQQQQQHHQHIPDLSPQPPDHHFMASNSRSSFGGEDSSTLTYPSAMSPEGDFHGYSQTQIPLNSHIQVAGSPHMPPVSPFPSSHPVPSSPLNSGGSVCQVDSQSFSPMGPSLSPPSSADSTSSQEDLEIPKVEKEILHQNFTDTEMEVLMRLMDHMSNFDILDKNTLASLNSTDILPLPLLRELQSQLYPPNNALGAASPASSVSEHAMEVVPQQRDFGASHILQPHPQPHLAMGACMEIGAGAMGVINPGMGIDTSLEMCSETMDVDSTSLDRGT